MRAGPGDTVEKKRKHQRVGYDMPLEYTLSVLEFGDLRKLDLTGMGIDISEGGLGFFTDYRLQPGHVIRIKDGAGSQRPAVVRWVAELDGRFRVGVLFYK